MSDVRPCLRLERLHLRGLKAIRSLDLPEDGLGWGGRVPDVVLVGGPNGSGKTTLLEFLFRAMSYTMYPEEPSADHVTPGAAQLEFSMTSRKGKSLKFCFVDGVNVTPRRHAPEAEGEYGFFFDEAGLNRFWPLNRVGVTSLLLGGPKVLYVPSRRSLETPATERKAVGPMPGTNDFFHVWTFPERWEDSLEALLYSARWMDLNAKEEGRAQEAVYFDTYASAFELFFDGSKRLVWRRGELWVETLDGSTHGLDELSAGEQQILLMVSELLLRWRPGSLVLIDEPELHLHELWQVRLWKLLCRYREERGGQLIVATQSEHFFQMAEPGAALLLKTPR